MEKLTPVFIDTIKEHFLSYENKEGIIYFRQFDIQMHLKSSPAILYSKDVVTYFLDTLKSANHCIKIFEGKKGEINAVNTKLANSFYFIAAELMVKNQFMFFSKRKNKIATKHLIAEKTDGLLGAEYLTFYFNGAKFYDVVTVFGE